MQPPVSDSRSQRLATDPPLASLRGFLAQELRYDPRELNETLERVLSGYYVHLRQKESAFAIDPTQDARRLVEDSDHLPLEEMTRQTFDLVNSLRDRHTALSFGGAIASYVAYLPFRIEEFWEDGYPRYMVTAVAPGFEAPGFGRGTEVSHWNGTPMARRVHLRAAVTAGANYGARRSLAVRELTVRSLGWSPPPSSDWVSLTYRDGGTSKTLVEPWRVYAQTDRSPVSKAAAADAHLMGLDHRLLLVNTSLRDLFGGVAERSGQDSVVLHDGQVVASLVSTSSGLFGYLRIFSFDQTQSLQFVLGIAEILRRFPVTGVIIDVRSNPGGMIPSGEGLLQLFARRPPSFVDVTFRATPQVRRLVKGNADFAPCLRSLDLALQTGDDYSQGFSLTSNAVGRSVGRVYDGPVALITDALSYSTTCFFAAGMQDNFLASVIGLDETTGAGGANVWTAQQLAYYLQAAGVAPPALPAGVNLNVAMRRAVRTTGPNRGLPLEDLGVWSDRVYRMTRRDVLEGNQDLIEFAGKVLARQAA